MAFSVPQQKFIVATSFVDTYLETTAIGMLEHITSTLDDESVFEYEDSSPGYGRSDNLFKITITVERL